MRLDEIRRIELIQPNPTATTGAMVGIGSGVLAILVVVLVVSMDSTD